MFMGMITTIVNPANGQELQIKTGWDLCNRYTVGDKIPWGPDPEYPGETIDGVHHAFGRHDDEETFVVIKDCVVVAVVPKPSYEDLIKKIKKEFGIKDPPRNLWSEDSWKAKENRDAEAKARGEKWDKDHAHLTPEQKMSAIFGEFLQSKMQETSLARRILPPKENKP